MTRLITLGDIDRRRDWRGRPVVDCRLAGDRTGLTLRIQHDRVSVLAPQQDSYVGRLTHSGAYRHDRVASLSSRRELCRHDLQRPLPSAIWRGLAHRRASLVKCILEDLLNEEFRTETERANVSLADAKAVIEAICRVLAPDEITTVRLRDDLIPDAYHEHGRVPAGRRLARAITQAQAALGLTLGTMLLTDNDALLPRLGRRTWVLTISPEATGHAAMAARLQAIRTLRVWGATGPEPAAIVRSVLRRR